MNERESKAVQDESVAIPPVPRTRIFIDREGNVVVTDYWDSLSPLVDLLGGPAQ
jgi:hypothetical protein